VDGKSLPHAAKKGATPSRASDLPRLDLPRETRLVRRAEYDAVYREGRRRSSREFTLFVRPNGLDVSRFGWSIKKSLGNAVKRNRIRRRLREIFRLHRREIAAGWDIVVHPRTTVATAEFPALAQEMLKLLNFSSAPKAVESQKIPAKPAE
jgi:ribonuclease P protein component